MSSASMGPERACVEVGAEAMTNLWLGLSWSVTWPRDRPSGSNPLRIGSSAFSASQFTMANSSSRDKEKNLSGVK